MKTYDWIVIGGGITGSALSYELQKAGCSVLLIEQDANLQNATRYGYGGIPYWMGTDAITSQLCSEGIALQRQLPEELGYNTEFREIDLLLTIDPQDDLDAIAAAYKHFAIPPQIISVQEACELEPLLNPHAIAGAVWFKHAHVRGFKLAAGYRQACQRLGGSIVFEKVEQVSSQGVITDKATYQAGNIAVCAGGFSRSLLKASGIKCPVYFTHDELIDIHPVEGIQVRTLIMPADTKRFELETNVSDANTDELWHTAAEKELVPPSIDVGAVQYLDGSLRIGQLSRILTNPNAAIDPIQSEAEIRQKVSKLLPALANLPGQWHHCLVAFSHDSLPLVGALPESPSIHLFTGFTGPMVYVPALARRFAASATRQPDEILSPLSPKRFA